MKWHEIALIALVSIVAVVAFVYVFGEYLPNVPLLSPAAHRLGGGA